jgi:serine/threonine protein kinase
MSTEKIGRYVIEEELGRGGMAVVYLAIDPFMNRQVAVKVLPQQFTYDPQFRARFQREAQVIASLDHPAIVPIYDFGEHEEQPYIVMRYMQGGSLADRLKKRGSFTVDETALVMTRIGAALDEAHEKGIVHRDLKPANILFDDRDDPFVGDFGIVKQSEATVALTGNNIIGTPGYMSPEQARGDDEIDGRSDIYALGAITYEMLTGKLPYESDTPVGLMMKHILEPVPNVLAANPDLPKDTAAIITTAMAKDRSQRYESCEEIASALTLVSSIGISATVLDAPGAIDETLLEPPVTGPALQPAATVLEPPVSTPDIPSQQQPAPQPVKEGRKIPIWGWAVGCLGLLLCGGLIVGLGGLGVMGGIFGDDETPTSIAISSTEQSATVETTTEATSTAVGEAEATAEVASFDFTPYQSESMAVSLTYPEGWFVEEDSEIITIASDPSLVDLAEELDTGVLGALFTDSQDEFGGGNPQDMLSTAIDSFGISEDAQITSGPTATSINGQDAAIAEVSFSTDSGTPMIGLTALVSGFNRAAFVVVATPESEETRNRLALDTIVNSVSIGELVQAGTSEVNGVVVYGDIVDGNIEAGASSIWSLIGFEGDAVDIFVEPLDEDLDVIVDVLDDSGISILPDGEIDASFDIEEIRNLIIPHEGNYTITIHGFGITTGNYQLRVFLAGQLEGPDEPGSQLSAFDTLEENDEHAFPFYAESGGLELNAIVSPYDELDVVVGIYNDDDDELLLEVDDAFDIENIDYVVPDPGNYYILISGFDNAVGDYDVVITGPPDITFELAFGDEVNSQLSDSSQIDYYFRAETGHIFTTIVQPDSNLDVVLEIYNLNDLSNILAEVDDSFAGESETLEYTATEDGVFVIRVRGFGGETGNFFLTIE